MFLSFLRGRRGIVQPFSVSFAIVIFLSLIGADWKVTYSIASFLGSLTVAEAVSRSLWEDGAIYRFILRFGHSGTFLFLSLVTFSLSLILNLSIGILLALIDAAPVAIYALGILIWTLSSSLLCSLISALGEMVGVSLTFISAILQIPLLVGFYGYLDGGDTTVYVGLLLVMGIFYLSFALTFSSVLFEE
ncbi:MAG: hypothetical protein GXO39_06635 [Thermotogae bacterium]|nr:hypothetical protein [Thermotogota bacterium]